MAKMEKIGFLSDVTAPNLPTYRMIEALGAAFSNKILVIGHFFQ